MNYANTRKKLMYQNTQRHELRQVFADVLKKTNNKEPLDSMGEQIAGVLESHPEYHSLLKDLDKDFTPEMGQSNPFLHMSLHLGIREQVSLDRPAGIMNIYDTLLKNIQDVHEVEHMMMDVLAETLHDAQKHNVMPNEAAYLMKLKTL